HMVTNYYQALGILPDASQAVIKAVYRARAMELHPDRNTSADATRRFQALQAAYDVLSDEEARAAYDAPARLQAHLRLRPAIDPAPRRRLGTTSRSGARAA